MIAAVVPALDEEATIAAVVTRLRAAGVDHVVVADNGSTDATAARAEAAGAMVVREPRRGYGAACLAGLAALPADVDTVLFADADGSDDLAVVPALLGPIRAGRADLVIGSRRRLASPGALTPVQRFGNGLATHLLGWWFGQPATDLGPLRAIRVDALRRLDMRDRGFGWTVEMQARAALVGLRTVEIDVPYRRRVGGRSKIAGTVTGSVRAGVAILWILGSLRVRGA